MWLECLVDFCVLVRMYDYTLLTVRIRNLAENVFLQRRSRHEAGTAEADAGSVGRGEQREANPGISASRGGPQLELSRRRLYNRAYIGSFGCSRTTSG